MQIREATAEDWPAIWPFFQKIITAGDTYTFDPDMDSERSRSIWMLSAPSRTVVAVDEAGAVLGSGKMNANQAGPGSHIANASYMVDPARQGHGTGRALCEYSIDWARSAGFRGIQFNAVAESNVHAIKLYESLGFRVIGTVPEGFRHPEQGRIGLHIMHLAL